MARIVSLIFIFMGVSCSTNQKSSPDVLSYSMKNHLKSSINELENISNSKDPLFARYGKNACAGNWEAKVKTYKETLLKTKSDKMRINLWFKLGNCYNYVNENKLSLYYYDLVLSTPSNTKKTLSIINFNTAQIYEQNNQLSLAASHYKQSFDFGDSSKLSLLKLGSVNYKRSNFKKSNDFYQKLLRIYPRSNFIRFLIGVNYYHLNEGPIVFEKLLSQMKASSGGRVLLKLSLDVIEKKNIKKVESTLKDLSFTFGPHINFHKYLLSDLGN